MATMHKILELDQENPTALYYVGLEEQKNGRQEQARAMWNRALAKVAPDDPLASSIRDQISLLPKAAKSR